MTTKTKKAVVNTTGKHSPIDEKLRKRAEEQVGGDAPAVDTSPHSEMDVRALLHELQVHQIELEMQNEELRLAQAEVEAGLEQYLELYDFAPVGYFSFDHDGSIQKINLTGAAMLNIERSQLIGKQLQLFLTNKTRAIFSAFLEKVFQTTTRQACEVAFYMKGGQQVFVRVEGKASEREQLCLAAVSDITEERKQAMELKECREQYRALAESTSAIAWEFDVKHDRWTYVAPQVQHILGYAPYEWKDLAWWQERIHPDDREWVPAYFRQLSAGGGDQGFEYRFITKDGKTVWLITIVNVKMRDNQPVMRGVMLDITGKKRSEEERAALSVQQEGVNLLLQSLLKPAPLETKLAGITEGIVQYFNADFCRIWLIRPGDLCEQGCVHAEVTEGPHVCSQRGRCLHLLASSGRYTHIDGKVHRRVPFGCYKIGRLASGEEHKFITNDVMNDPQVHDHEWAQNLGLLSFAGYQLKVPEGETIGVLALFSKHPILPSKDAMLSGLSSAVALAVQQATAENALRENTILLNIILNSVPLPVFYKDSKCRYIGFNKAYEEFIGKKRDQLLGMSVFDIAPRELAEVYHTKDLELLRGQGPQVYESQVKDMHGDLHDVIFNKAAFIDSSGRVLGLIGVIIDITERKRAAEALIKSEQRITIMDRISTIFLTAVDEEVYSEVMKVVLDVMESRLGIFGFIADNGDLVIPSMTREVWDACRIPDKSIVFPPDTWGESLWGKAIREKKTFYSNETFHTPEGHLQIDNFLAVPIVFAGKAIGLLSVGNKNGGYCEEDKELQESIASRISPILNARLQRDSQEEQRRRAEEELRLAMDYNRSLIEASLDPLVTISRDGTITDVNAASEKITGYLRNELIGKDFSEYFTEPEKARAGYQQVFENGTVRDFELDIRHRDGHATPVLYNASVYRNQSGAVTGVFAVARDMTAHYLAVEELRKFSAAIEQSPVSIVITDINGKIEFINPKFTQMTGYSFDEVRGGNPKILKSGKTTPEEYGILWTTILSGNIWSGEFHNRKKDGELFWEYATISPIVNKEGIITHFLAIKEDITEKKALEEQLFQAQKMEAIGQLAGGIAHDFNNILTAIIGFSSLIEMDMDKGDPQRDNLNHIFAAADRAANLTKSLLAFSRKQIMNPQPINLNQIIKNIEKFLQRIIGEDIVLKTICHQDVLTVKADCGQIEQVLMNLAVNARDAMPHGGILSIDTRFAEIGSDFIKAHGYGEPGQYALVSLTDSGLGMDEITRKRVFDPFFTTKELGKGTGLGLSIVFGIIKQHNGFINVYSEPGVGTTFNIYLPLIQADLNGKINHVDEIPGKGTETILVADDDAALLELTEKILGQFGYTVITAVDGLDAVNKFSENKVSIELVILDIIMPKMNGKEALDEILKIRPGMKSIFISGYTADIIHNRGILDESLVFIAKPLKPTELLQKVREVLDRISGM